MIGKLCCLLGLVVASAGWAGDGEDLMAAFARGVESRVTEFKLENGLEVIIYVDSAAPVVSTNLYYRVGFYYDPLGLSGLSHMMEHMTFKRTDVYAPGEFFRMVKKAGGVNNGFTSSLYTAYFETFARDRWELALKIEAARMAKCVLPDSEFITEHEVVAEETRLHQNFARSVFWEQFSQVAFLANPQRNGMLTDDCRRFTAQGMRDWYNKYYNPANAILVITGDVRPDDVRAKVEQHFGKLMGTPVELPDYYDIEPEQTGERRITVRKRVESPSIQMGWHVPGVRDSNYLAGNIVAGVLGAGRNCRLYRALVRDSGLATSVWAYSQVERDPSLLMVGIAPKAESLIPRIERIVDREVARVQSELITERELEQFRNSVLAEKIYARDDISNMGFSLAHYQITTGSWRAFKEELEMFNAVTRENVRDFARKYLKADNRTVGLLLSAKEGK